MTRSCVSVTCTTSLQWSKAVSNRSAHFDLKVASTSVWIIMANSFSQYPRLPLSKRTWIQHIIVILMNRHLFLYYLTLLKPACKYVSTTSSSRSMTLKIEFNWVNWMRKIGWILLATFFSWFQSELRALHEIRASLTCSKKVLEKEAIKGQAYLISDTRQRRLLSNDAFG